MGLYNFQSRFVPFILAGSKKHTIRAMRKIPPQVGETLHLYTGLRRKGAKLLMRVPCVRVQSILITPGHVVRIDGEYLDDSECQQLARADGFQCFAHMMQFWEGRLPFEGHIIHWKD